MGIFSQISGKGLQSKIMNESPHPKKTTKIKCRCTRKIFKSNNYHGVSGVFSRSNSDFETGCSFQVAQTFKLLCIPCIKPKQSFPTPFNQGNKILNEKLILHNIFGRGSNTKKTFEFPMLISWCQQTSPKISQRLGAEPVLQSSIVESTC